MRGQTQNRAIGAEKETVTGPAAYKFGSWIGGIEIPLALIRFEVEW